MSYLIFRGVATASDTLPQGLYTDQMTHVYVSKMPAHRKAAMRFSEYYVKGRDGALHVDEGLANFDIQATLVLMDQAASVRQMVNAWADGTGKLITSDSPTLAYRASVLQEVEWSRKPGNSGFFDTATVTFNCQPYMYEAQESVYTFTANGTIANVTSATALPKIVVSGTGTCVFSVAGEEISISGMEANVPVTLDCETGYIYTESGAKEMTGNFPELQIGNNSVVLGSGVTEIVITPHWRWI